MVESLIVGERQSPMNVNSGTVLGQASIAGLLGRVAFFAGLSKDQLKEVATIGKVESRPANELVFSEGDPGTDFYVILEGKARIHKLDLHGTPVDLTILTKGTPFGAEALLQEGVPQSASVSTLESCLLFCLSRRQFFTLLARYPVLIRGQLANLSGRIRQFHEKLVFQEAERQALRLEAERERFRSLIDVARAVSEARTLEDALLVFLDRVCAFTGWTVGHAYLIAETFHKEIVSSTVWHVPDPHRFQPLIELTAGTQFAPGSDLHGVLDSGKSLIVPDLLRESNTARARLAIELGLKATYAFPVLLGNEVVAILEFFADKSANLGELLVQTMHSLGVQVGRAIERKRWEEQLVHNARHDSLTGLPNRDLFLDRLELSLAHVKRHPQSLFAVLFLDLDRFKQVNDGMGHAFGDNFLIEVGYRLQTSVRAVDTVARLGGDEFAILLDDLPHMNVVPRTIERIRSQLALPINLDGRDLVACASIGIALSSTGYEYSEDVLRDADIAMYRAKNAGRGQVQVFDRSMHEEAIRLLHVESGLRRAIQEKELRLHYQPIVSMETGQIAGFEALVRWAQPDGKLLAPDSFLPIAEQSGLMPSVSDWVIQEGCRQLREWQDRFAGTSKLYISLNLTPSYLAQPDLVERVSKLIAESQLSPSQVVLEITEGEVISNVETGAQALRQLSDAGIRIFVDDFGTGYSSLSYLARLRVNALKIDRSFINQLPSDLRSAMIVRTIVTLGQNLGLEVVAEGVETQVQRDFLRDLNCDFAQGFLFHKPLAAEDVTKWFLRQGVQEKEVAPARLHAFDLFSGLSEGDLAEIAQAGEERTVPAGTVMIRQGQVGQEVFFLEQGEARVYRIVSDPAKYIAVLQGPSVFGERALMDPERIRTANVEALTDLRLIAIQITTLIGILRRQPVLENRIKQLIQERLLRSLDGPPEP